MVEGMGAEVIDINMGCPAKKVTGGLSGSALMRDPDHALRLIEAVVGAVAVPVTLKMRLGWDDGSPERARSRAPGRGGGGAADHRPWPHPLPVLPGRGRLGGDPRGQCRRVGVPVIANGDIDRCGAAAEALAPSGADGVMIGRGAQGAPWLPAADPRGAVGRPGAGGARRRALVDLVAGALRATARLLRPRPWPAGRAQASRLVHGPRPAPPPDLRRAVLTETDPTQVLRLLPAALATAGRRGGMKPRRRDLGLAAGAGLPGRRRRPRSSTPMPAAETFLNASAKPDRGAVLRPRHHRRAAGRGVRPGAQRPCRACSSTTSTSRAATPRRSSATSRSRR